MAASAWKVDAVKLALKEGALDDEKSVVMIYNIPEFKNMLKGAVSAFTPNFLHTMAVKSNPVLSFLKEVREQGLGVETASLGELSIALAAGFSPSKIIFDSPAKTIPELKLSLEKGVYLNLDNFQEFERVKKLIESNNYTNVNIGIRINPQVGGGAIEALSTATATSKFGIPTEYLPQILDTYKQHTWLNGVHVHVGSQGCPLDLIAQGISKAVELALTINKNRAGQIKFIDIGGGLPVNFGSEEVTPTFEEYAKVLKQHSPVLFTDEFVVITEFGRTYNAKVAVVAAKVEYTKLSGGRGIAVIQAGADLFVRTVYVPEKWPLRVTVLDKNGDVKNQENDKVVWDIAGPCCFAGDIVAHRRALPSIIPGDIVVVHDTGAYYFSSFSHYNCRQAPPIYGFDSGATHLTVMKKGETVEDTIRFYS